MKNIGSLFQSVTKEDVVTDNDNVQEVQSGDDQRIKNSKQDEYLTRFSIPIPISIPPVAPHFNSPPSSASSSVDDKSSTPQSVSLPDSHFLDYYYHRQPDSETSRRSHEFPEHYCRKMAKRWNNRFYQKVSIMTDKDGE